MAGLCRLSPVEAAVELCRLSSVEAVALVLVCLKLFESDEAEKAPPKHPLVVLLLSPLLLLHGRLLLQPSLGDEFPLCWQRMSLSPEELEVLGQSKNQRVSLLAAETLTCGMSKSQRVSLLAAAKMACRAPCSPRRARTRSHPGKRLSE